MKKKFLVFGLLASSFFAYGQKTGDAVYKKQRVSQTDIQVLFSYYNQHGNHSAVTGGTGTEALHVYAPEIHIAHQPDTLNTYLLNFGVDVVTSASNDNIDFVKSSASRVDSRSHISIGYSRRLKKSNTHFGINTGFSIESAYLSFPAGLSFDHVNLSGSTEVSAVLQCFFDDLRWGRIDPDYYRPISVVYPYELRYAKWDSTYRRTSYNLDLALYQVINKKAQFALFPELVVQHGLLSTPYHRVYFNDHITEKVEHLPAERWKLPVGMQLNIFPGRRTIIRAYYRFYYDNFGIQAHSFQLETPVKLSPVFTIAPHLRFHTQSASKYFSPFAGHNTGPAFYTSDYDLSAFNSYEAGFNLRYAPHARLSKKYFFKEADLKYAYYKRTDGLEGHIISVLFDFNRTRIKK